MYELQTDGTWLCRGTAASWFGDKHDVDSGQDNGISAFGYRYVDNPACMGVALPTQKGGDLYAIRSQLVPYTGKNWDEATKVRVYSRVTKRDIIAAYTDKGPSTWTHRAVDLLPACVPALGLSKASGLYVVDVRVLTPKLAVK